MAWGDLSRGQQIGLGASVGASVLPMLFGGGADTSKYERQLGKLTDSSLADSQSLGTDAKGLFASLLPYIQAAGGGDRQALLGVTMPERKRVIDQYATARKSIGEFSPRSGGQAASMALLNAGQASDLSMVGANARANAQNQGLSLAGTLQSASQNASAQAAGTIGTAANLALTQQQMQQAQAGQWGEALGLLAGLAFL